MVKWKGQFKKPHKRRRFEEPKVVPVAVEPVTVEPVKTDPPKPVGRCDHCGGDIDIPQGICGECACA